MEKGIRFPKPQNLTLCLLKNYVALGLLACAATAGRQGRSPPFSCLSTSPNAPATVDQEVYPTINLTQFLQRHQATLQRMSHGLGPILRLQLPEHAAYVGFGRFLSDAE